MPAACRYNKIKMQQLSSAAAQGAAIKGTSLRGAGGSSASLQQPPSPSKGSSRYSPLTQSEGEEDDIGESKDSKV